MKSTRTGACRPVLGVSMACLLPLALALAQAQNTSAQAEEPGDAREAVELSKVTMTGLKRESLLQDTPAAITSLDGGTLEATGATRLDDFFRSVPGLQVQEGETGAGRGRMSVRGVRLDYSYTGRSPHTFRPTLPAWREIGGYDLVNLRIGYRTGDREFAVFGRNLLDGEEATFSDGTRGVAAAAHGRRERGIPVLMAAARLAAPRAST